MLSIIFLSLLGCRDSDKLLGDSNVYNNPDSPSGSDGDDEVALWEPGVSTADQSTGEFVDIPSSSQIALSWEAPSSLAWSSDNIPLDHYELLIESEQHTRIDIIPPDQTTYTVTSLRSGTSYSFQIIACLDEDCASPIESAAPPISLATEAEHWLVLGDSNDFANLYNPFEGNISRPSILQYGADADQSLLDITRLYYDQIDDDDAESIQIAKTTSSFTNLNEPPEYTVLTRMGENFFCQEYIGNFTDCDRIHIGSPQAVPMEKDGESFVRLFFRVELTSDESTIAYMDSIDGLVGLEFDPRIQCEEQSSLSNRCPLNMALSTQAFEVEEWFGAAQAFPVEMSHIERFKILWNKQRDWKWNPDRPGLMLIEGEDSCDPDITGIYVATFDGMSWNLLTDNTDCPVRLHERIEMPSIRYVSENLIKIYHTQNGVFQVRYIDISSWDSFTDSLQNSQAIALDTNFIWHDESALNTDQVESLHNVSVFSPSGGNNSLLLFDYELLENGEEDTYSIGSAILANP